MPSGSPESRLRAILEAALDMPPAEQAAFLEAACQGEPDLKAEALSLLEHDRASAEFLATPAMEAAEPMRLRPGSRLGPYEVIEALGAGAMGEVYRAHDPRFGRDVAIKLLPAAFGHDEARLARFEREARAAGSLNHPNVLTVHDFGCQDGTPYLVSELLRGETLRARLQRTALSPATAAAYAAQIARGLGAAHAVGIVHRDLKPENVFVVRGGGLKILDFGLAQLPEEQCEKADGLPTEAGAVVGSPGYLSPEQIRAEPARAASDIFSLGVISYEMLAGKRPFPGATWVEEMNATLHAEAPPLPANMAGIADPNGLRQAVERCLAKQPEERFESARDLAFLLETLAGRSVPRLPRRRRRTALWAAAAVLLAGVGLAIFFPRHAAPPAYERLTFRRGTVSAARFTSGDEVVYSAAWDGAAWGIFQTRSSGQASARPLSRGGAMLFSVSRDDRLALCLPRRQTQHGVIGSLVEAPLSEGGELTRAEDVSAADWSPGGALAAVRVDDAGRSRIEYPLGSVAYAPPYAAGYIDALRVSPDGGEIAFLEHPLPDDSAGWVATVRLADKMYRKISGRYNSMRGLAWSADGKEVWFAAARQGINMALWAARRSGGKERRVVSFPSYASIEDIARDGRMLISFHSLDASMVRVSKDGKAEDLAWHDQSQVRDISPGGLILFSESGDATRQDYEAYVRGPGRSSPATYLGMGMPLAISGDGRWVIANPASPAGAPAALTLLPAGPGESRRFGADGIDHLGAAWLPDGKRFLFAGSAAGQGVKYYVQSAGGGAPREITPAGVYYERRSPIVISPAGDAVAALDADGRIAVYPVEPGGQAGETRIEPGFTPLQWCPDGRLVAYRYYEPDQRLWKLNLRTGAAEPWKDLTADPVGLLDVTPIRISPDCRSYVYSPLNALSKTYAVSGLR
ncbi:MAG TPA: WD40 repeat domain-containing serine/threonine protein kinase [Bryobacteraceae bacterium]|nr:WD40 repeat domain-containing serine/threonine protein kinase [Bryobacteraceae bacterium]